VEITLHFSILYSVVLGYAQGWVTFTGNRPTRNGGEETFEIPSEG
jgi:hypothetical protein